MNSKFLGIPRYIWCHILAATVAAFIVAPLTFMALDREDPVEIYSQRLEGDLIPGGTVELIWNARAKRVCDGVARGRIISAGGIVYEYDDIPTVIRSIRGESGTYSISFTLPRSITPGPARREVFVRYYCNPFQRWVAWPIVGSRRTLPFEIKNPS